METYIVANNENHLCYRITYFIPRQTAPITVNFGKLTGANSVESFVKTLGEDNKIYSQLSIHGFGRLPGRILNKDELTLLRGNGLEITINI